MKILSLQTFPPFFLQLVATIGPKGDKSGKPLQNLSCSKDNLPNSCKFQNYCLYLQRYRKLEDMSKQEIIDSIRQVALSTLPANSNLLLYGSRARGDYHEGSDWDLLILLDKPYLSFNDYSVGYPFRELGWEIDEEINPQVYSKKEWDDYQFTPFYKNVESDKITIL